MKSQLPRILFLVVAVLYVVMLLAPMVRAGNYGHANIRAAVYVQPVYQAPQTLIAPVVGAECYGAVQNSTVNYGAIMSALQAPQAVQVETKRVAVQQPQTIIQQQYVAPVRAVQFQSASYGAIQSANVAFVKSGHRQNVQFVTVNDAPRVEKIVTEERKGLFGLRRKKTTQTIIK